MTIATTKLEAFFLCQKNARGDLGKSLVADSVVNSGGEAFLFDVSEYSFPLMGYQDANSRWVWRYDLDGNDERKRVIEVYPSLGRLKLEGLWSNQTNTNYVIMGIDPHKVLDAMDAGYAKMMINKVVVMTKEGADLDMELEEDDLTAPFYWSQYLSGVTAVKQHPADPANKVTGEYVLKITLTSAGGSLKSAPVRAVPGDTLHVAPCLRVAGGGPFTMRLWDHTNGAYFGETAEYNGAEFAYFFLKNARVPDDCNYWQLEITGTDNGGIAYLDCVSARSADERRFNLEDWIDERWKLPLIHRVMFKGATLPSTSAADLAYPATKREYGGDLVLGTHYQLEAMHTETNRYVLAIESTIELGDDIFYLETRRHRSEKEPWTDKDSETTAGRGELLAFCMAEIADLLAHETGQAFWTLKAQEWAAQVGQEVAPRAEVPYTPPRETVWVRM
jgi:hypothetical protein